MSSTLRIAASRANGARSRGPVTEAGKLASAANGIHAHGAVTPEGQARSAQLLNRYEVRYSREYQRTLIYYKAQRAERMKNKLDFQTNQT